MTTQPFVESGMTFGPFPEGQCFRIEKSTTYAGIQQGVKMAEFLLLRTDADSEEPPTVWVVEAKSSAPRSGQPRFDDFIGEIREKLLNAFSLGLALRLGRHPQAETELPEPFRALDPSKIEVRFVLVINGHKDEWLDPVKDALLKELRATVKTWALGPTPIAVLNENLAKERKLIA